MKTKLFIVTLFLLAVVPLSFARLGETLDQCKTRYGAPTGQYGEDEFIFTRDHTAITVHFRANRSVQEDFGPDAGSTLSEAQVAEILQENSEGSTWEANGDSPVTITYFRRDGRAAAQCAKKGATLTARGAVVILKYTPRAIAE